MSFSSRSAPRVLAVANALALAIHLAATFLPRTLAPQLPDVGQVSAEYPTAFTPAGLTFAIWGVIYLFLAAFCVYHLIHAFRSGPDHPANRSLQRIGWLFVANNLATAAWLLVFVQELLGWSLLLIMVQVATLIAILIRIRVWNWADTKTGMAFTQTPLSVYAAWLCIATIANAAIYLKSIGWDGGLPESTWAVIMIAVAALITLFMVIGRGILPFGLVVLWALYGIVLGRREDGQDAFKDVISAAWIAFAAVGISVLAAAGRKLSRRKAL